MKEKDIVRLCMAAAHEMGAIVWRNNTGALLNAKGRLVRYGLCVGSSDLIGIYQGRFLAIECKTKYGKTTTNQTDFINTIKKAGGIAFVAKSPDDVKKELTFVCRYGQDGEA